MCAKPYTIALTGGIASGKSRICQWLEAQGYPVINADQVAKEVSKEGTKVAREIKRIFGTQAYLENGALNRAYLREKIFSDPSARQALEAITHPAIHQQIKGQLKALNMPLAFVEIPLLVETGKPDYIDEVWVADCPEEIQLSRCMARGLDEQTCLNILSAQATRDQRQQLADQVIPTDCIWTQTEHVLQELLNHLKNQLCPPD